MPLEEEFINGVVSQDVSFLIGAGESRDFQKEIMLDEEIKAPLGKGEKIGTLNIIIEDKILQTLDIVSDRDVMRANVFDYFKKIYNNWIRK